MRAADAYSAVLRFEELGVTHRAAWRLSKAKVAVARKLAVLLHAMWISGEPFRWSSQEPGDLASSQ